MAGPVNITNSVSRLIDTIYLPDGTKMVKMGIGTWANVGDMGDNDGAAQMVGTNLADGDTLQASEAVVVVAGVAGTVGDPVVPLLVDSTGRVIFASGATDDAAKDVSQAVYPTAWVYDADGSDTLDDGDIGLPRVTSDRKPITVTSIRPEVTAGTGRSMHRRISTASTNAVNVKASAGKIFNIFCNNQNAAVRYLKIYDLAVAPTIGTSTPMLTLAIPPANNVTLDFGEMGLEMTLGIGFGMTTGVADSDTAAVAANEHVIHVAYA